MKQNTKLVILGLLVTAVVFTWLPKDTKPAAASAETSQTDDFMPDRFQAAAKPVRRSDFTDWGRDPFTFLKTETETTVEPSNAVDTSELLLRAIMLKTQTPSAYINDSVVVAGDTIGGLTVKQIERNRVVLTDQTADYVLELQKEW